MKLQKYGEISYVIGEKTRTLHESKNRAMGIDLFFLIIAGYGFFLGYSKGLLGTVIGIFGFLLALVASFKFTPAMSDFFQRAFHTENPITFPAGFLAIFLIMLFLLRWMRKNIDAGLSKINLNIINQLTGGFIMAVLLSSFYSGALEFMDKAHLLSEEAKSDSIFYPTLQALPERTKKVWGKVQPFFIEFWNESIEFMDKMQEQEQKKRKTNEEGNEGSTTLFDVD